MYFWNTFFTFMSNIVDHLIAIPYYFGNLGVNISLIDLGFVN